MLLNTLELWNSLGNSWDAFQSKPLVEALWSGLAAGIDKATYYSLETQKSRSLAYMSPLIDVGPVDYVLTYSGVTDNVLTVEPLASGGSFYYEVDTWTYSIPTLEVDYKYRGTQYTGTYTEDVDYSILGLNFILWGDTLPTADARYPSTGTLAAHAPHVWRVNPALMDTWARFCGFAYEYLADYESYGQDLHQHLKMLIWALVYKQMRAPSIKNLSDAFAISRGMPFAYEAGTVASVYANGLYETTVGDYTYTLLSGMIPVSNGTVVAQFDVIASGIQLYDYTSNPALVNGYANVYSNRNTLVFDVLGTATSLYNQVFHDTYINRLMPKQVAWFQNGP